jgi:hypothetical protein
VTFTLRATSGSNPINYVKVESDKCGSNCNSNALLVIEEDGGTIPSIQRILKSGGSNAEFWVQRVEISGYVGDQSDPSLYPITTDIVSRIIAGGGIYADIIAGPRTFGGTSTIVELVATNGPIRGSISALYGAIDKVSASGVRRHRCRYHPVVHGDDQRRLRGIARVP